MQLAKESFAKSTQLTVRNYEIDWQGIVHNAVYLLYFEVGRLAYLQEAGIPVNHDAIRHHSRVVIARNEINYVSPARFGDRLNIYTRVSAMGNTSFTFEGLLEDAVSGRRVAENVSVHVWLDETLGTPVRVPEPFRDAVLRIEGKRVTLASR